MTYREATAELEAMLEKFGHLCDKLREAEEASSASEAGLWQEVYAMEDLIEHLREEKTFLFNKEWQEEDDEIARSRYNR